MAEALVGILACSKLKRSGPTRAEDLYTGRTFRAVAALLRARGATRLVVLSVLHGPVDGSQVLAPYDRSLVGAGRATVDAWASDAAPRLRAMVGDAPSLAVVPAAYAGALAGVPRAVRLFAGLTQGRLYAAVSAALRAEAVGR